MKMSSKFFLLAVIVTLLFSCKTEPKSITEDTTINVALLSSLNKLSPMLTTTALAREIYVYMFYPMADYDPVTLELSPILAKEVPEGVRIEEGEYEGSIGYTYEIRDEAVWDNGLAITSADYVFTLKCALHPMVEAPSWRSYLGTLKDVITYDDNPKKFTVVTSDDYFLMKEASCTFEIYPEYVYDSSHVLRSFSTREFLDIEKINAIVDADSSLIAFANRMNGPEVGRDLMVGAGPYKFVEWVDNQYITLEKKENWWGEKIDSDSYLFKAYPRSIRYQFFSDNTAALTALKDGSIDVLTRIRSGDFSDMQSGDLKEDFNFLTPDILRYYYLALNNQNPKLSDKNVRRALAHCLDIDQIIENLDNGNGSRTVGHFNPVRSYYNKDIQPISFDLEEANNLLDNAGWVDSDTDGIRDKQVDGQKQDLSITYMASSGELGQKVGLLLQENARQAGINIDIQTKEFRLIRQDLANQDFEITPLVLGQDVNRDDPYAKWHTDNAVKGKGNWFGYGDTETDALIETIRYTSDEDKRNKAYLDLQQRMHDDTPVIFLYSPKGRIVVNGKYDAVASAKRPGYFLNTFKLTEKAKSNLN